MHFPISPILLFSKHILILLLNNILLQKSLFLWDLKEQNHNQTFSITDTSLRVPLYHVSHAMCQLSPVLWHLSHVTCHICPIKFHLSPVTNTNSHMPIANRQQTLPQLCRVGCFKSLKTFNEHQLSWSKYYLKWFFRN